jgi:hypothetical protein
MVENASYFRGRISRDRGVQKLPAHQEARAAQALARIFQKELLISSENKREKGLFFHSETKTNLK